MKSIPVSLKNNSYKISFGDYQKEFVSSLARTGLKPSPALVVTTQAVQQAGYPKKIISQLKKKGWQPSVAVIPNGETAKNIHVLKDLYQKALKAKLDRRSLVVAVGGGVVTDVAGFLAATYMRGIPYVSVPTTLLAMVDAAIGGKTGIDLKEGKNLVGAFWQPKLVWIDQKVLKTLPTREWKTGFAEILKYGVIKSPAFFSWLEKKLKENSEVEKWGNKDIHKAIFESAKMKAQVVSQDEKETPLKGGREILNLGHTIGHALEAATVFGKLTHGEAISIGMAAVGSIALDRGTWNMDSQLKVLFMLQVLGLPIHCPEFTTREKKIFWESLKKDKKHVSGKLRFVIPQKIGKVTVESGIPLKLVEKAMRSVGF